MKKLSFAIALASIAIATGAAAHDTVTPHESRGDCESALAHINTEDRGWLAATFPQLFSSKGDVQKYLHDNFKCELNDDDGYWYIVDHRFD
jgi:hypothetical protein